MLIEACLVMVVAVTCLNEAKDTKSCVVDPAKASIIIEEFQTRTGLTLRAAESVDKAGSTLYRAVWENKKGEWRITQYIPDKDTCTVSTPEEYREQHRKEQRSNRWL